MLSGYCKAKGDEGAGSIDTNWLILAESDILSDHADGLGADGYRLFSLSSKNSLTCSCVERVTAIRPERVYCNTQPYSFRA